jgi:hypothetical protein
MESELGFQVEDEELVVANFATLRCLGNLIASKTLGKASQPNG